MKKILICIIFAPIIAVSYFLLDRYSKNLPSITPYPYKFTKASHSTIELTAPILIIGDSMGARLNKFSKRLSEKISVNLSKPIKVQSIATEGEGIHRTIKKLKSLNKTPLIIIYVGQMDQSYEYTFSNTSLKAINKNFELLDDDRIHTAMMLFPILSRFIYNPVNYVMLGPKINKDQANYEDHEYQKRQALQFTLYKNSLNELFKFVIKKNSLLIPLTTPINIFTAPLKSCYGSVTGKAKEELALINDLIEKNDYKRAFNNAKELTLLNPYNSKVNYTYHLILRKLNRHKEAQKYGELAKVYDCKNNRANPVYNAILKAQSKLNNIQLFDFHQLLMDESTHNHVFLDETYPQDFYFEKLIDSLARRIKNKLQL